MVPVVHPQGQARGRQNLDPGLDIIARDRGSPRTGPEDKFTVHRLPEDRQCLQGETAVMDPGDPDLQIAGFRNLLSYLDYQIA